MSTIKLKLTGKDLRIFSGVLHAIITREDVQTLRHEKQVDYLLFSCISELWGRADRKLSEIEQFGLVVKTPGKAPTVSVTVHRHEAIALYLLLGFHAGEKTESYLPAALADYTINFLRNIAGIIHKAYMV